MVGLGKMKTKSHKKWWGGRKIKRKEKCTNDEEGEEEEVELWSKVCCVLQLQ